MNIIGKKYFFLGFSGVLMLLSLILLSLWGLRLGIDFTGGSLLEVEFSNARPASSSIRAALVNIKVGDLTLQPSGDKGIILRFKQADEAEHQDILRILDKLIPGNTISEKRFNAVGPTIGKELKFWSVAGIILAIVGIVLYVAWAFRKVSAPVASWKYGVVTIVALVHDVLIPAGAFSVLGHFAAVEIDGLFISALLTILGFSVHDTIVVFDRIRENLLKLKSPESYELTVNRSINETIARSINTSFTVLLVLVAVLVLGGVTTKYFALALIIGIIFGTYSSIFIASPLLVIWNSFRSWR